MKNILVILASPSQQNVENSICDEIRWICKTSRLTFRFIDLYREDFDPIIRLEEPDINLRMVRNYQEMISECDVMVFISPVYWNRPMAMMEGFLEKVFIEGFAYEKIDDKYIPLLHSKKALFILTSSENATINKIITTKSLKLGFLQRCFKNKKRNNGHTFYFDVSDEKQTNLITQGKVLQKLRGLI